MIEENRSLGGGIDRVCRDEVGSEVMLYTIQTGITSYSYQLG